MFGIYQNANTLIAWARYKIKHVSYVIRLVSHKLWNLWIIAFQIFLWNAPFKSEIM